jgi:DNA (cytosine-5)-methyltransferase 1
MGYHRAGFEVVGVDIKPQRRYPFEFHQGDALEFLEAHGHEYDVIHASPPCQRFSEATPMANRDNHPDLIKPIRELLLKIGRPFIIENVENARGELQQPLMLCGTMFNLPIWRHRYFETRPQIFALLPSCRHEMGLVTIKGVEILRPVLCTGGGDSKRAKRKNHRPRGKVRDIRLAMEIDWMVQSELTEAIPPAYTEYIGKRILEAMP